MTPSLLPQSPKQGSEDSDERKRLLELAVEKLVRYGQKARVTPEEMLSLLDSGVSIRDLLAFLVSKNSGAA